MRGMVTKQPDVFQLQAIVGPAAAKILCTRTPH